MWLKACFKLPMLIQTCDLLWLLKVILFFWLSLSELMNHMERRFFISGNPVSSTMMLMQSDYKVCGELIAMSIMHGGQAPCLFSQSMFEFLIRDLKIANIHSSFYKSVCEQVICCLHQTLFGIVKHL